MSKDKFVANQLGSTSGTFSFSVYATVLMIYFHVKLSMLFLTGGKKVDDSKETETDEEEEEEEPAETQ